MSDFKELRQRVLAWAKEKGILHGSGTIMAQSNKNLEEAQEIRDAVVACDTYLKIEEARLTNDGGRPGALELQDLYENRLRQTTYFKDVRDGIGDNLVTLIITAEMAGIDPIECLEEVLEIIEKRTGKMVNGEFRKNDPIPEKNQEAIMASHNAKHGAIPTN